MKNNKLIFTISLLILIVLGFSVTRLFDSIIFKSNKLFYLVTWLIAYSLLLVKLLFLPSSYSKDSKNLNKDKKINAIISSYNEDEPVIRNTIESILNQSYPVNKIYLVDDGSTKPVKPFYHPKLVWLRKENAGKRYAQAFALERMEDDIDYILTVDSDSRIEKDATKKMMVEFQEDPSLMGITGLVLTDNFRDNLLTRIIDLNIAVSCISSRPIRSYYGALETTSGALSMYKSEILLDNIEDYVTSGSYSDDRQLCFYSSTKGNVKALTDLTVESIMPNNLSSVIKQRIRWAKGSWIFFKRQMKELSFKKKIFPIISMFQTFLILVFFFFIGKSIYYRDLSKIFYYFIIRYVAKFSEALLYIGNENRMTLGEKILTLIFIVPLEVLFTSLILSPIKYIALFYLKDKKWLTR